MAKGKAIESCNFIFAENFLKRRFAAGALQAEMKQQSTTEKFMSMVAEREMERIGASKGAENHDHDMIHELSKRLDALWRYDQYVVNADGDSELQDFWRELKEQEQENVKRLKEFVAAHIEKDCF